MSSEVRRQDPVEGIWKTWPRSRHQVERVFRRLTRVASRLELGLNREQVRDASLDDPGYVEVVSNLCSIEGFEDLSRSFKWVLAALGDEDQVIPFIRELREAKKEAATPDEATVFTRLMARWLSEKPLAEPVEETSPVVEEDSEPSDSSDEEGLVLPEGVRATKTDHRPLKFSRTLSHGKAGGGKKTRGVVVCTEIGDAKSKEASELTARFKNIINEPLPFRGSFGNPAEIARAMAQTFPWAHSVARYIGGQLALLRGSGEQVLKLPPMLLVGPPGSGKTHMLEWLCEHLEAGWQTVACGGTFDAGGLAAVTRGWSTARPSAPVQAMADLKCANPVLILDEVEKGSEIGSRNGSVAATLISMLQSRGMYFDACLLAEVDISRVSFLATANSLSSLPPPLCDRFVIFTVPRPTEEHFDGLLHGVRAAEARRLSVPEAFLPWLSDADRQWLRSAFVKSGCSIRALEQAHRLILGERAAEEMEASQRPN